MLYFEELHLIHGTLLLPFQSDSHLTSIFPLVRACFIHCSV